jgi:hypothetical protein
VVAAVPGIQASLAPCLAKPAPPLPVGIGIGTAPQPTATPTPLPESRTAEIVRAEAAAYQAQAAPIALSAARWSEWTGEAWASARLEARVVAVLSEGVRLAASCAAAALTTPPPEAQAAHASLVDALEQRSAHLQAALDHLKCCATSPNPDLDTARETTASAVARALSASYSGATEQPGFPIEGRQLGVLLAAPPGWQLARNDSQLVLFAPPQVHARDLRGIGPGLSTYGTAFTVRRARAAQGGQSAAISQALVQLSSLGQASPLSSRKVGGGVLDATVTTLADTRLGWHTRVALVVFPDFVYFLQLGCPAALSVECSRLFDGFVTSTSFEPYLAANR